MLFSEVFCQASTCTNDVFIVCFCGLKVDFDLQLLPERFLLRQHAKCCWTLLWGQSNWTAAASMPQRPVTQQLQEQPTFPGTRCPPNMNWFRTVCGLDLKELSEFQRLLRDRLTFPPAAEYVQTQDEGREGQHCFLTSSNMFRSPQMDYPLFLPKRLMRTRVETQEPVLLRWRVKEVEPSLSVGGDRNWNRLSGKETKSPAPILYFQSIHSSLFITILF